MDEAKKFWAEKHQQQEELWLTGTSGPEIWNRLGIVEKLERFAGQTEILNIGIGTGRCTKDLLLEYDCNVSGLDVTEEAFKPVEGKLKDKFLTENLPNMPKDRFDLILSHLVTQHINDNDLAKQLVFCIPSLKQNGIFAMQFAQAHRPYRNDRYQEPIEAAMSGSFRMPRRIINLSKQFGGQVLFLKRTNCFIEHEISWWVVHIVREDYLEETTTGYYPCAR